MEEMIGSLAGLDKFFDISDRAEKDTVTYHFQRAVWEAGPYLVVILDKDATDAEFNIEIVKLLDHCDIPTIVMSGLTPKRTDPDGDFDGNLTRLLYGFSSKDAAEWFAGEIEKRFAVKTASYRLKDAGPDTRTFIVHDDASKPVNKPC